MIFNKIAWSVVLIAAHSSKALCDSPMYLRCGRDDSSTVISIIVDEDRKMVSERNTLFRSEPNSDRMYSDGTKITNIYGDGIQFVTISGEYIEYGIKYGAKSSNNIIDRRTGVLTWGALGNWQCEVIQKVDRDQIPKKF